MDISEFENLSDYLEKDILIDKQNLAVELDNLYLTNQLLNAKSTYQAKYDFLNI